MTRKENQRSIKQIIKSVEDRDVQFRKDGFLVKGSQARIQKIKKKAKSRPRATN
jgi:hypothetical protein